MLALFFVCVPHSKPLAFVDHLYWFQPFPVNSMDPQHTLTYDFAKAPILNPGELMRELSPAF